MGQFGDFLVLKVACHKAKWTLTLVFVFFPPKATILICLIQSLLMKCTGVLMYVCG